MATEVRSIRGLGKRLTLVLVMLGSVLAATGSSAMPPTEPPAAVDEELCDAVHPHPCPGIWTLGDRKDFVGEEVRVQYVRVAVPRDYSQGEADSDPSKLAGSVEGPLADTIELEGWIGLPDLPGRAKAPVALFSTTYLGDCNPLFGCDPTPGPAGDDPTPEPVRELLPFDRSWWSDTPHAWAQRSWGVRPIDLVRRGYAAAFFSVRGTGGSGGCWENGGRNEQADQAKLVEWLADQPWSNGRVAMGGISAPALTALSAAKQSPKALKAIVISGITTDEYTFFATPQGAAHPVLMAGAPFATAAHAFGPPLGGGPTALAQYASVAHDRLCPEAVSIQTQASRTVASDRDSKYFLERRHSDDLGNVKAAVLLAHGFQDSLIGNKSEFSLHTFQEDNVWKGLTKAPKRIVEGQWGHEFPVPSENPEFPEKWSHNEWSEILFNWLDYWLKGIGHPENLNKVDYQDQLDGEGNEWHQSDSWPPSESKDRTFYLSGDDLSAKERAETSRAFRATPQPLLNSYLVTAHFLDSPFSPWAAVCKDSQTPDPETRSLLYTSKEQDKDFLIAGNPRAELSISSDLPGGIVGVHLVRLGKSFSCERAPGTDGGISSPIATQETSTAGALHPTDIEVLAVGAADLRFYKGNFKGEDFGVNQPTPVKIDLSNLAARVPAGSQLALIISAGDFVQEWGGQPYYPKIAVHSATESELPPSRLIIPVVPPR